MSNNTDDYFVKKFFEEYKKATVNLDLTERGYNLHAEQALPDRFAQITLILELIWVLAYLSFSFYLKFSMEDAFSNWEFLLIIPGLIIVFFVGSIFPVSIIFSIILLINSIIFFPHWLFGGSLGFYALTSLLIRVTRWYAADRIKRLALGCDDNFIQMLKDEAIKISLNKHTSKEAQELLNEISQKITLDKEKVEWEWQKTHHLNQASKLHELIKEGAKKELIRIGFHRFRSQSYILKTLRKLGYKRTFLSDKRQFIRDLVALKEDVFNALYDIISIHAVYEGKMWYWDGLGKLKNHQHELNSETPVQ